VSLPTLTLNDPSGLVLTDAELAEERRFCGECDEPVGRSYLGQPGFPEGFCENCGTAFSFTLKLTAGDLVAGKYRIDGPLARGGLGWVYLARDLNLDRPVVLKGLINTKDRKARELAANEKVALTALDHPNVVRIHDFVRHPDPDSGDDYIVMEYVGGPTLADLKVGSTWLSEHGPMTPEYVITYVLEILGALDYLHGVGLLYCDMKPANAIRGTNRLKVIDLGAVHGIDDATGDWVGTRGYRVSDDEADKHGFTVRSDLHTVGKTLEVLYQVTDEALIDRASPSPISLGLRSLRHVYERAMDDYHRRFATAPEMAEQLTGVLREIVALRGGAVQPSHSTVFAEQATLLDAGLGTAPSLGRWTDEQPDIADILSDGLPAPQTIATALPVPLVRPDDPGAAFLATLSATDPGELITKVMARSDLNSLEIHLRACRAAIELDDLGSAADQVTAAGLLLGHPASADWRLAWHRGLIAMAGGAVADAEGQFTEVYRDVPGEDAPKLALGLCAEHLGRTDTQAYHRAEAYYQAIWAKNTTQASAAFGLARVRLARHGRAAATTVLDEVRAPHAEPAKIAAISVLCGRLATADGLPSDADLTSAVDRLDALLSLDGGESGGPARTRLTAMVRKAALHRAKARRLADVRGGEVLGDAPTERSLSKLLEGSFRELAGQARTRQEHGVLVDHANAVRPHTVW
jgi:serine/threonine-protein kinase PknG